MNLHTPENLEFLLDAKSGDKQEWLLSSLKELGWSKLELSRKLGRRPETVSRWKDDIPDYVIAFVKESLSTRWLLDRYVTKMMDQTAALPV